MERRIKSLIAIHHSFWRNNESEQRIPEGMCKNVFDTKEAYLTCFIQNSLSYEHEGQDFIFSNICKSPS